MANETEERNKAVVREVNERMVPRDMGVASTTNNPVSPMFQARR